MSEQRQRVIWHPQPTPEDDLVLQPLRDWPEGPCVLVECPPEVRTTTRLAKAVLAALGKRVDLTGTSRDDGEAWLRARAWLQGERPSAILVNRADVLPPSHWQLLVDLARTIGTDLFLIVEGAALRRGLADVKKKLSLPAGSWDELVTELDPYLREAPHLPPGTGQFPFVPDDEFPSFLATARRQLEEPQARLVERTYWRAFEDTQNWAQTQPQIDPPSFQTFVATPGFAAPNLNEMTTRLRAAQAALLLEDIFVSFDTAALAAGYANLPQDDLNPAAAAAIRRLEHPLRATAAVIALLSRRAPPELAAMNVGDIAADGREVSVGGQRFQVPDHSAGILRAMLTYRAGQDTPHESALFVAEQRHQLGRPLGRKTAHGLQIDLRSAAQEIGISLTSRAGWARQPPKRWLAKKGLTVRHLDS